MDERIDIYDANKKLTGRTRLRRQPRADGDFGLVVFVIVQNSQGLYLITKRAQKDYMPGLWENTGGVAIAGETSIEAAMREFHEETGFTLLAEKGCLICTKRAMAPGFSCFMDVWLFEMDFDIEGFVPQKGETIAARWAAREEILKLHDKGEFVPLAEIGLDEFYRGYP
ncbi:MAG: NUDIX domain-containing protein [Oscillospiraceae bacterium]|jgi:8-oxo-dGTP pyrophosphatase MutT (NUDIX family)|nr:NUDIX domain-containing protein [Oscillospiraceae bacterium]